MRSSRGVALAATVALAVFCLVGPVGVQPAGAASSPVIGDEHTVATRSADAARESSIAFDGTNYFEVWTDIRGGATAAIHGARIARDGTVLDPGDIRISVAAGAQTNPDVVFDGTDFVVVWGEAGVPSGSDIRGARVSTAGVVRDPAGITISNAADDQWAPKVAFNGSVLLVAWNDHRTPDFDADTYGGLVSPDGIVLTDPSTNIAIRPGYVLGDVASDGTNFVVAVTGPYPTLEDSYRSLVATSVSGDGQVGPPVDLHETGTANPSVAFDGTVYLFVWEDYIVAPDLVTEQPDIYGTRVTSALQGLDNPFTVIASGPSVQTLPQVAWNGAQFVVTYKREANGDPTAVKGSIVGADGQVVGSPGFVISSNGGDGSALAVAAGPGRDVGVAYERHVAFTGAASTVLFRSVAPK